MVHKIAFFNHKGGVSKTTTVFHLGWMLANLGKKVLLIDADSQCNLTKIVLKEGYESFYEKHPQQNIKSALSVAFEAKTTVIESLECISIQERDNLFLMPGSFDISEYEVQLGVSFQMSNSFTTMKNLPGALNYLIKKTAERYDAEYVLIDMNPSLSAINQALLLSSDYFIVPTSPDYFSKMALESLSKILPQWERWAKVSREMFSDSSYPLALNTPKFLGYTINNYTLRKGEPAKAFDTIIREIDQVVVNKFIPQLKRSDMLLDDDIYMDNTYKRLQISNFQTLGAKYQSEGIPVYELSDIQLKHTGTVLENQQNQRDAFRKSYEKFANDVILMIQYAESHAEVHA
jgi:chromosome partitioning protein